jgi:hypothetical protein
MASGLLGLFTRLAAVGAAIFLTALYLAMPPWPYLPGTTAMAGHYLFVNFHVIEILAVLAAAVSGRWFGLDALIHAVFARQGAAPTDTAAARAKALPAGPPRV